MNYHRKSKSISKDFFLKALFFVLLMVLLYSFSSNLDFFLTRSLHSVAYPFWKSKAFFSKRLFVIQAIIKSKETILNENRELKNKLLEIDYQRADIEILTIENKQLRSLLEREEVPETLQAFILARPPQTLYDVLIIDIGKKKGLKGGEKVFFRNILLGEIIEVFEKTASVRLLSSGGFETKAYIDRINLPVIIIGKGSGNFESKLPKDANVEIGDFLIIPGERGKLLGQVEEIESNPSSSFIKIFFRLPLNLQEIRWVSVEIL